MQFACTLHSISGVLNQIAEHLEQVRASEPRHIPAKFPIDFNVYALGLGFHGLDCLLYNLVEGGRLKGRTRAAGKFEQFTDNLHHAPQARTTLMEVLGGLVEVTPGNNAYSKVKIPQYPIHWIV